VRRDQGRLTWIAGVMAIHHQLDNQKTVGCIFPTACEPKRKLQLNARLQERGNVPIATFSSFTDGLDRDQRSRDHFITNTNLEDDRLWVPYAEGVWFQPCHFNVTTGGFSVVLKGLPGSKIGTHYHVGTVHGYTLRGHWRYLEHDWVAKPGTFIYEPAGEAHTLVITDDSPEPMVTLFIVGGGLIYLDKAEDGGFAAYEDGFSILELCRKHYRQAGLDARQLDLLVR
jgi:2,4'-dihydroxyacetophenone dioxygenase